MGSLVAALASWLDAKANQGQWLIRIEDVDQERCKEEFSELIIDQLTRCGLQSDREVVFQSHRKHLYDGFLSQLAQKQLIYPCKCSRAQILNAWQAQQNNTSQAHPTTAPSLVYPGTCRPRSSPYQPWMISSPLTLKENEKISIRMKTTHQKVRWLDRRLGWVEQDVLLEVGDFVIKRADGPYSYQLCVVADDIDQGVTHVVRGEDLADNTARQILLYEHLLVPRPVYLHVPLVKNKEGEKLSKQTLAPALELDSMNSIISALKSAASHLGLEHSNASRQGLSEHLRDWTHQWSRRYPLNQSKFDL